MESKSKSAFTLIELIIVMAILAILMGSILGNFFTSLKKERDARRKLDLQQIQKGLELYYQDKNQYPASISFGGTLTDPGGSGKVYMQSIPSDPQSASNNCTYTYSSPDPSHSTYFLYSFIENTQDTNQGVRQTGYGVNCTSSGTSCNPCRFSVSSSNTAPQ